MAKSARSTPSPKEAKFITAYLGGEDAGKAAITAGYAEAGAHTRAFELLRKPHIREEIDRQLREMAMSSAEVLHRLTRIARADLTQFLGLEEEQLKQHPQRDLLKKYTKTTTLDKKGNIVTEVRYEVYSALDALTQLGRYHGLFLDRTRLEDWRSDLIEGIRRGDFTFQDVVDNFENTELVVELFRDAGLEDQVPMLVEGDRD